MRIVTLLMVLFMTGEAVPAMSAGMVSQDVVVSIQNPRADIQKNRTPEICRSSYGRTVCQEDFSQT